MPTAGLPGWGARAISPAVMPMLHLPGLMTPGQLGPSRRTPGNSRRSRLNVSASSCAGMPSVMHTMNAMPAAAASSIADGAPFGGTEMKLAFAPVRSTASFTEPNTGMPSISSPARLGFVPPTTLVPYALFRSPWYLPWLVGDSPWIRTVVRSSTKIAISAPPRQLDRRTRRVQHRGAADELVAQVRGEDRPALLCVRAVQPDHDR